MFSGFGRAFDNAKAQTQPAVRHPADVDDGFFHILPSCITYQLPFDGEYPAAVVRLLITGISADAPVRDGYWFGPGMAMVSILTALIFLCNAQWFGYTCRFIYACLTGPINRRCRFTVWFVDRSDQPYKKNRNRMAITHWYDGFQQRYGGAGLQPAARSSDRVGYVPSISAESGRSDPLTYG